MEETMNGDTRENYTHDPLTYSLDHYSKPRYCLGFMLKYILVTLFTIIMYKDPYLFLFFPPFLVCAWKISVLIIRKLDTSGLREIFKFSWGIDMFFRGFFLVKYI